jgi:hypothetical protein
VTEHLGPLRIGQLDLYECPVCGAVLGWHKEDSVSKITDHGDGSYTTSGWKLECPNKDWEDRHSTGPFNNRARMFWEGEE